jgi:AcrR family transcriptional regulator
MKVRGSYHSPLRESQAAATRQRIVGACVALTRQRADVTYAAVAAAAGVQERTVYRHFPKKEDLETAVWDWIVRHLTHADFAATDEEQLVAAMRQTFAGFGADAPLIQAMLHSRQGLDVRRRQQPMRRAMFEACVGNAVPGVPPQVRGRAAAVLQVLYSGPSWELLRSFWDMDGTEAADTIELGIRSLLAGLRLHVGHEATSHHPPSRQ